MKKSMLFLLLFSLSSSALKADLGSCVVYHAKFYLKNGAVFKGCFEVPGYFEEAYLNEKGSNRFCNNRGVYQVLKYEQRSEGKVKVYKKLHYVYPRSLRKKAGDEAPVYGFAYSADLVLLDSNDIARMVFQRAEYSRRSWLTSDVIIGSQGMLDTIRNQRSWNTIVFRDYTEADTLIFEKNNFIYGPYKGFALHNYNPRINVAEMKRLIAAQFPIDSKRILQEFKRQHAMGAQDDLSYEMYLQYMAVVNQKIRRIQQWFWKKGILLVVVRGTC